MPQPYERLTPTHWEWDEQTRRRAVRLFPARKTLVWSSRLETDAGPAFDDGLSQTFKDFLARGPAAHPVPESLIVELRQAIADLESARRGWWPFNRT